MPDWNKNIIYNYICACGCKQKFTSHRKSARYIRNHFRKFQTGSKSPSWNGGIIKDRDYIKIYSPKHPHNHENYVKRSRLTMEKKLGRFLESWEVVHHINGIKDDDRIENLVITTLSKHNHIHKPLPKNKWSKEFDFCQKCGSNEIPHQAKGMCHNCYHFQWKHKMIS